MMFGLFKKQKEIKINPEYYLFLQDKWAKKMTSLTSDLSRKKKLFFLVLFVIIAGSVSIYNIFKGFLSKDPKHLKIEAISKPSQVNSKSLFLEN